MSSRRVDLGEYTDAVANACMSLARIYGEEYARHCDGPEADDVRQARARRIALRVAQQVADGKNETFHWSWMTDPAILEYYPRMFGVSCGECNERVSTTRLLDGEWAEPNERGAP